MLKEEIVPACETPLRPLDATEAAAPRDRVQRLAPSSQGAYRPRTCGIPSAGQVLGKCLLIEALGRGGSCLVFRALHQSLNVAVAVKALDVQPDDPAFPRARQELRSEAQFLARLQHPHIVRIFDFEDDPDVPFLVLECVDGTSLRDLIRQSGRLQTDQARKIVAQVAAGLAALWDLGVVHRDVKPGNILLGRDGTAKLADLGQAARIAADPAAPTGDPDGIPEDVGGTAGYLAPEQVLTPARVDRRSDMYSLGVTFYEAVTGRLPFEGRSRMEVLLKHAKEPPPPPRRYAPDLEPALEQFILTLLAKDPDDRFPSAEELLAALAPPAAPPPTAAPLPRSVRARPTLHDKKIERPDRSFWRSLVDSLRAASASEKDGDAVWLDTMKRTLIGPG
jgi:eukaryotic-like serine/threonine-protein kinase